MKALRRIITELEGQSSLLLTGGILFLVMEAIVYFFQAAAVRDMLCLYDPFTVVSYTAGITLFPLGTLFGIFILREDFRADRILRIKKMSALWLSSCGKMTMVALLCGAAGTVWCGLLGKLTASETYNWDRANSLYTWATGRTIESVPYWEVVLLFFVNLFLSILASEIIVLFVYWVLDSWAWGVIITSAFSVVGCIRHFDYDLKKGVNYYTWLEGVDLWYQLFFPAAVIFIFLLAGLWVKKKDLIKWEKG